jgi:hypothetical protein
MVSVSTSSPADRAVVTTALRAVGLPAAGPPVVSSAPATPHRGDRTALARVRGTLTQLASERVDEASTALLGATLAMVAAGAIALLSIRGDGWLITVAAALCAGAAAAVTIVRRRLAQELLVVAEAHGLPHDVARTEVRAIVARALRLD